MAIQTLNTIKNWFQTGFKPSQKQFWETWDSFRHKFEKVPVTDIEGLESVLDSKAEKSQIEQHENDQNAHSQLFATKEDKSQKGIADGYVPLDSMVKIANNYLYVVNDLISGGSSSPLSAEQGKNLQNQINGINILLTSDNIDLDTIQEIVDAIEEVQMSLSTILVNDLISGGITKALTAEMGKLLNEIKHPIEDQRLSSDQSVRFESVTIPSEKRSTYIANYEVRTVDRETYLSTRLTPDALIAHSGDARKLEIKYDRINFVGDPYTDKKGSLRTNFLTGERSWFLQDRDGTIALDNDFVITAPGTTVRPALIIPNGELTSMPQNGSIERDSNGNLWETHGDIRSKIITTADNVILMPYSNPNIIQTNIQGNISTVKEAVSENIPIGKIENNSVLRLNFLNQLTYSKIGFSSEIPTVTKVEVFLKLNNGLFAINYNGDTAVNQVKILEFSGALTTGNKRYQDLIVTSLQNVDSFIQSSKIDFVMQNVINGITTDINKTYYLRDAANTKHLPSSDSSFSFVFVNTLEYADTNNTANKNCIVLLRNINSALFLEKIR